LRIHRLRGKISKYTKIENKFMKKIENNFISKNYQKSRKNSEKFWVYQNSERKTKDIIRFGIKF